MESFKILGISEPVLRSIKDERFESPSEIQEKSIPLIIAGKDVIAGSATGSGKTLAFAAGILKNSEKGRGIQALVLTPTRELAEQVAQALSKFSKYKPLEIIAVYGGVGINPQIRGLKTADVVVGTPGRLLDHIARNTLRLGKVKTLVLDEADRMFDMGFKYDVEKIILKCPQERQTLLFSATINKEVVQLSRRYMHEPLQVSVDPFVDP
ncbi:MAG: DEAD/DEAH box helicase, partial [Candidatus Methanoperedens sp.]|nr:DEAD/DEAH box helicase [Candidatus Methanoperedens sp.]